MKPKSGKQPAWEALAKNVALAALAAFSAALVTTDTPTTAIFVAAGYAALRAGVGALLIATKDFKP